ncbi:hypothetical protein DXG03_000476 [Asterophora parasitica]|uniref:dihydroneopterin aldolase n=1 Tax=Asterophora parasitica TaxID=117018 RepID=A0A9P7GDM2_9AGAR|nr:hypothetical protein DXG03_000476 [Asterophora parasitica]
MGNLYCGISDIGHVTNEYLRKNPSVTDPDDARIAEDWEDEEAQDDEEILTSSKKSLAHYVVFVNTLHLAADVGPDCWGKSRLQPVEISVYLHLQSSFLTAAGQSDDVLDSVHYGHLSKAISAKVDRSSFNGIEKLVAVVAEEAFALAGEAVTEVRVVANLPKQILLAEGLHVDFTISKEGATPAARRVSVVDLVLPVLIGVNPPEREAKQRVITNIVFHERPGDRPLSAYPQIVADIVKNIDASAYLTLEKFVLEIVRTACLASDEIDSVTVRSQKPSALSFAHSSGVEITRRKIDFPRT